MAVFSPGPNCRLGYHTWVHTVHSQSGSAVQQNVNFKKGYEIVLKSEYRFLLFTLTYRPHKRYHPCASRTVQADKVLLIAYNAEYWYTYVILATLKLWIRVANFRHGLDITARCPKQTLANDTKFLCGRRDHSRNIHKSSFFVHIHILALAAKHSSENKT